MVNPHHQEDGDKNNPSPISRLGAGGPTRSWGPTVSGGHSVSTSGSVGSPSSRSEAAVATPASESTFNRLNNLDIQGDDAGSQGAAGLVFFHSLLFLLELGECLVILQMGFLFWTLICCNCKAF